MTGFDLIIRGGTVIDGSRAPRFDGDVGVIDGRIAAVGDLSAARAADEFDARARIVAPGFIDCHTHDDQALLSQPDMGFKVSQGVTTVIAGNCGISLAPRASSSSMRSLRLPKRPARRRRWPCSFSRATDCSSTGATSWCPSKTTTTDARNETRTFRPIRWAGTEYFAIRTVIRLDLSTRGCSVRPGSNRSYGSGDSSACSTAKSWPTVRIRDAIRRLSSAASQARILALSSARESTTGMGVKCVRRNRPTSPSTPPFSCAPVIPGWQ